ncbi:hypothetical protein [Leucobacter celer]|uniref:hypothetical protein n=1 Tax=Leucobacter celer TaxID=668625 RepID=UPI0006A7B83E|nr:hypothetical protein [Leucobacter celer]
MQSTEEIAGPVPVSRPPGRWKNLIRKAATALLAVSLVAGGSVLAQSAPAEALPEGESWTFSGGLRISNFVLPGGKRVYCIEAAMSAPSGAHSPIGTYDYLPGATGYYSAWHDAAGMRQLNYLIDTYGQNGSNWDAAAVQLTVWRMRANFGSSDKALNQKITTLQQSKQGRDLIARSDALVADARKNAKAPVAPKKNTGKLTITEDPNGVDGRYRIAYPKGTTKLSVKNGTFVRNGKSTLDVGASEASARYVDINKKGVKLEAAGTWVSKGTRGWEPKLTIYNTRNSNGVAGQRVALASGASTPAQLSGTVKASITTQPPIVEPVASSQAQASAEVGGTMQDTLIVTQPTAGELRMWPNAVADFTAYLQPTTGAIKYDSDWNPVLGDEYEVQAEDPDTGEALWADWWAAADGSPLLDADGAKIPTSIAAGTAADGTAFPVQKSNDAGDPVFLGADGAETTEATDPESGAANSPVVLTGRDPVMETKRDPVRWTGDEISGMTAAQLCVAQPVYRVGGIAVPGVGRFSTPAAEVKSAGTIHWVERVTSNGSTVHQGRCGLANETTRIGQPGVETNALQDAVLGDELYDVATVSGTLSQNAEYSIRFDAYTGDAALTGTEAAECTVDNRIFRSGLQPVTAAGDIRSPGFTALWEHGETVWWVETLMIDTGDGPETLHQGECGIPNETTTIGRPSVETKALEEAVVGDHLTDTAIVTGELAANEGAQWEVTFTGYREEYAEVENQAETVTPGEELVTVPVCTADNQLFETGATEVTGPGEYVSNPVIGISSWVGKIWWVEQLWLIQGEDRTLVHTGECGLPNETTILTEPEIVTQASDFVVIGDGMSDTATITGDLSQREGVTHEVVFEGYRGSQDLTGTDQAACTADNLLFTTDPVSVPADVEDVDGVPTRKVSSAEVTALPAHGDTVWWVEKLIQREGDDTRELKAGKCGLPNETTNITQPEVRTESAGIVTVGDDMWDTAIVDGVFPEREDVEFTVTFKAYAYNDRGEIECTPENELQAFEDATGVKVDKPGRYESKKVKTTTKHVGIGGYVETLTMRVDGQEHMGLMQEQVTSNVASREGWPGRMSSCPSRFPRSSATT